MKVGNTEEAWKFITFDTHATCMFKVDEQLAEGFDDRVWNRDRVQSRLKELQGMELLSKLNHPHIV